MSSTCRDSIARLTFPARQTCEAVWPDMKINQDELRQRLIELVYDLLDDDEAESLRRRISSEPDVARAYSEVWLEAQVLAKAVRQTEDRIVLRRPDVATRQLQPSGPQRRTRPGRLRRALAWTVAVAAAIALLASAGTFLGIHSRYQDPAERHLRLLVTAPAQLVAGVDQTITVTTQSVFGTPVPARLEFALYGPDQEQLLANSQRIVSADPAGFSQFTFAPDRQVPPRVRLEVLAHDGGRHARVSAGIAFQSDTVRTRLALDKSSYRSGDVVRYRSRTLAAYPLTAQRDFPVEYRILDPDGVTVDGSTVQGTTQRGVGNGQFHLPLDLVGGPYLLVARSLDGSFLPTSQAFFIGDGGAAAAQPAADPARVEIAVPPRGGVWDPGQGVTVEVLADEAGIPLVVTAHCRGVQVGQTAVVTRSPDGHDELDGPRRVTVPLPETAGGVVRLTVHDCRGARPRPVVERLVLRRPAQWLDVRLVESGEEHVPGGPVELTLLVRDETGRPASGATLGVTVADDSLPGPAQPASRSEIEGAWGLDEVSSYFSGGSPAVESFDLALAAASPVQVDPPPVVLDNLDEAAASYAAERDALAIERAAQLVTLGSATIIAGLVILVAVAIAAVTRVMTERRLLVPTLGAATACLLLGGIWMGSRPQVAEKGRQQIHFAPEQGAVTTGPAIEATPADAGDSGSDRSPPAHVPEIPPLPVRDFAYQHVPDPTGQRSDSVDVLYWNPLVIANREGRATIRFDLPAGTASYRVQVDAHAGGQQQPVGRIGTGGGTIVPRMPATKAR